MVAWVCAWEAWVAGCGWVRRPQQASISQVSAVHGVRSAANLELPMAVAHLQAGGRVSYVVFRRVRIDRSVVDEGAWREERGGGGREGVGEGEGVEAEREGRGRGGHGPVGSTSPLDIAVWIKNTTMEIPKQTQQEIKSADPDMSRARVAALEQLRYM